MRQEPEQQTIQRGAFDLREIAQAFYKGWYIVALCTVASLFYGINSLQHATYLYSAQMQVTPPQSSDTSTASRFSTIGALGAMAGALPPSQNGTQFALYVETLKSRDFADEIAKDPKILHTIFKDYWDEATESWQEPPPPPFSWIIYPIRAFFGLRPPVGWQPPAGEALQGYLAGHLDIIQDPLKSFLVKLIFRFPDRDFAMQFLNTVSATADNMLRQKALLRSKLNIAYLSKELNTVTIAEQRVAIADTLSGEEKFAMSAGSGAPFAADIFEKPWVSSIPTEPQGRQVLFRAALLGIAVGGALSFLFRRFSGRMFYRFRSKFRLQKTAASTSL